MTDLQGLGAALGGVIGLLIGSFIATLVARWGAGRSVLRGRSRCDGCARALSAIELVPLFGFALRSGGCPACGHRIDRSFVATELAAAAVGAACLGLRPDAVGAAGALFGWLLLALALLDARHFWLPDTLTALLAATGVAAGIMGIAPALVERAIGGLAGFGALWLIGLGYRRLRGRDGLGGGDAKLLGGIGLWLGWQPLAWVVFGAAMLGLGQIILWQLHGRRVRGDDRLAFGTLLAAAALAAWLWGTGGGAG